jgi:hypothetical protein
VLKFREPATQPVYAVAEDNGVLAKDAALDATPCTFDMLRCDPFGRVLEVSTTGTHTRAILVDKPALALFIGDFTDLHQPEQECRVDYAMLSNFIEYRFAELRYLVKSVVLEATISQVSNG